MMGAMEGCPDRDKFASLEGMTIAEPTDAENVISHVQQSIANGCHCLLYRCRSHAGVICIEQLSSTICSQRFELASPHERQSAVEGSPKRIQDLGADMIGRST
ncbi:hypothetical protein D9M69_579930 [compost metagenome]